MLSVIIPAFNEENAILQTAESLRTTLISSGIVYEIIIINDGSSDNTGAIAESLGTDERIHVIHHPKPAGYGYSLKDGIKMSRYDLIAITDADGTYPNDRIPDLCKLVAEDGYDMAVGARTGREYLGSFPKKYARRVFVWLSEYATGQKIDDINSGLRVFRKEIALKYIHTIGNGFSFTTTITLASLLDGYFVRYIPITYYRRVGKSHINYRRDTLRSLQIIIENILYFNPLKLFLLLVAFMFGLSFASFFLFVLLKETGYSIFFGCLSAFSFTSAFVIAAIGLLTDFIRISSKVSKSVFLPRKHEK